MEVEVVLWRRGGSGTAAVNGLGPLTIRTDNQRALASAVEEVQSRTGLTTSILDLTDKYLHLELLDPTEHVLNWTDPVTPITGTAAWNRPGWFTETRSKIQQALEQAVGASQIGPFRQVKHWSISALIEVETDVGTFWFKQVPQFMAHEAALTAWLSTVRPGAVPDLVSAGGDWFLAEAFDPPAEGRSLESPYGLLAELQLEVADRTDELLELGCPDRTPTNLLDELRALAARPEMLEPALAQRLLDVLPRLGDLVEQLQESPITPSVVHGDLHAGNWTRRPNGSWLVFDWTDGCVAHPFVDLGLLPSKDVELRDARLASYLSPWRNAFGDDTVAATLAAALPIAAGFHALSYERIVDGVGAADSGSWKPAVASHVTKLVGGLA